MMNSSLIAIEPVDIGGDDGVDLGPQLEAPFFVELAGDVAIVDRDQRTRRAREAPNIQASRDSCTSGGRRAERGAVRSGLQRLDRGKWQAVQNAERHCQRDLLAGDEVGRKRVRQPPARRRRPTRSPRGKRMSGPCAHRWSQAGSAQQQASARSSGLQRRRTRRDSAGPDRPPSRGPRRSAIAAGWTWSDRQSPASPRPPPPSPDRYPFARWSYCPTIRPS